MNKVLLSLNFVYCMERFATQIYLTQRGAFNNTSYAQQLTAASANEKEHVEKFQAQIKKLSGNVYPFGFLFQSAGVMLGFITRLTGKLNLFKANSFVEIRAVKDYSALIENMNYDKSTIDLINGIIADEEIHIRNWKNAVESLNKKSRPG